MRLLPADAAQRWLAVGNLVNMIGSGATLSVLVVFLSQVKGLPLTSASSLLAVAGLVAVVCAVPVGQLSDRHGARGVAVVTELFGAAATLSLLWAGGVWACGLGLTVRQLAMSGNTAARATLMGKLVSVEERARLRAYQRSVTNIGFLVGSGVSAAALAADDRRVLWAVIMLDAATSVFSAYATLRLPGVGLGAKGRGFGLEALGDRGYLAAAVLNGAHALNRTLVSVGVPLWVVYRSALPTWATSVAMALNTCLVIAWQVPLGRRANGLAGACRSLVAAGLLTGAGCAALALATPFGAQGQWPLFLLCCGALAMGELLGAAAGWTLSYDLASEQFLGQYQGLWQLLADGSAKAAGPGLTGWAVAAGVGGWSGLTGGFTTLAVLTPAVLTWARVRTRLSRRESAPSDAR